MIVQFCYSFFISLLAYYCKRNSASLLFLIPLLRWAYHITHLSEVYNSVAFSIFIELCVSVPHPAWDSDSWPRDQESHALVTWPARHLCICWDFLLLVLVMLYLRSHCLIQGHEDVCLCFENFIVLALAFRSLIRLDLMFECPISCSLMTQCCS